MTLNLKPPWARDRGGFYFAWKTKHPEQLFRVLCQFSRLAAGLLATYRPLSA
jgi:hypothetical protein